MRILMCSPHPLVRELGAPKVLIELAEALREIGVTCDVVGPSDARPAAEYDVVELDHEAASLPCEGAAGARVLIVARSVLLVDHLDHVPLPWLRRARGSIRRRARFRRAEVTLRACDLINVSNDDDKAALVRRGYAADKIVVLPFGLSAARRAAFEERCNVSIPADGRRRIAFVGTFDYRKGARDFGRIAEVVCFSGAEMRLLGTAGMFQTEAEVLRFFPRSVRAKVEVVPRFNPDDLPTLLADCATGVFPSYYEGFGFGVLEMLAAAIPVIAYDAPGPSMMLPRDWLMPPGNTFAMSAITLELLRDPELLARERVRARQFSNRFDWLDIARRTVRAYENAMARRAVRG
jgi:glycosyltransferase involved in cell wall biosynthesis